jgi:protein TonB
VSATLAMERDRHDEPNVLPFALTLAIAVHGAIAWFTPSHTEWVEPPPAPLDVELAPPPEAPKPDPTPPELRPQRATATRVVQAPAKAAAGRLLTAEPSPSHTDTNAPLDFVTDPDGKSYGFGVVSRGGTSAGEGVKTAVTTAVAPAPVAPSLAAPADLAEKPHLLAEDPCRGFYPGGASIDAAAAVVRVIIEPSGKVRDVTLVSETPAGEGFGAAARQCIRQQRFSPPRDHDGHGVATATTIRVRFDR